MKRLGFLFGIALWSALVFAAGYLFQEHQLLHSNRVETLQPLTLVSLANGSTGELPAGTTLYRFQRSGDQTLYVAFIGTKALSQMKAQASEHWLEISPVTAFAKDR